MVNLKFFVVLLVSVLFTSCNEGNSNQQIANKNAAIDYFYTAFKVENFEALNVMFPKEKEEMKTKFIEMLKKVNKQSGKITSYEILGTGYKKGDTQILHSFNILEVHLKRKTFVKVTILEEKGKYFINSYQHYKNKEALFATE